jgi:hypothetical protein
MMNKNKKHPIIVSTRTLALARAKANPFVDFYKKQKHDHPSIIRVLDIYLAIPLFYTHTV